MNEKDLIPLIKKEEKNRAYSKLQESVLDEGHIPPMPFLFLREMNYPVKLLIGSVIGTLMGVMSLVFTFLFFVYIMHMEF